MTATLQEIAEQYEGSCTSTDLSKEGGGRAKDYNWEEIKDFPLEHLGSKNSWIEFYNLWQPIYLSDLGYDRLNDLKEYMESDPDDPIIVVKWTDNQYYIWDGCHRTSVSYVLNRTSIHAIVGTL